MQRYYLVLLVGAGLLVSGCGGDSSSSRSGPENKQLSETPMLTLAGLAPDRAQLPKPPR
ncbi:MAG: hypothetical protein VYA55_17630 [Pseudomonadota bacterium]|nr:hypothetical protein [Pseudomonadota bacterium]